MAITSIPTEKIPAGATVRAEILESTVADGNHVDVGQIVTISWEAFVTLRAYGKARLAPEKPAEPEKPTLEIEDHKEGELTLTQALESLEAHKQALNGPLKRNLRKKFEQTVTYLEAFIAQEMNKAEKK